MRYNNSPFCYCDKGVSLLWQYSSFYVFKTIINNKYFFLDYFGRKLPHNDGFEYGFRYGDNAFYSSKLFFTGLLRFRWQ